MSFDTWHKDFLERLLISFESLEKSVSIVIQGPLHERMKVSIPHYLNLINKYTHKIETLDGERILGNLVISYWANDNESIIENYKNDSNIVLVKNDPNLVKKYNQRIGTRGSAPWIYQNYSCYHGVKKSTGHLCIKVRSDEIYPDIETFHRYILKVIYEEEGPTPFFTNDIFFRKDEVEKFHPSDHLIGGLRSAIEKGFEESLRACKGNVPSDIKFPEQLICRSFLKSRNVDIKNYKSKDIMKQWYRILPLSKMPNSTWTCSYRNYDPLRSSEPGWIHDINDL